MADVLIASDADWVRDEVRQVLSRGHHSVHEVAVGSAVLPAARAQTPDLAVLDFQMGSMGAVAVCADLHLEEGAGRLGHVPVLMLLDRRADVFLAKRSNADGWLVKPLDPIRLRRAIDALLAGGIYFDATNRPETVVVARG
jgi:DNA-binding NarL/FixJ family response regulator